jgi:hypothetical protein
MYLGGSIMTFALPYGAFIVIAGALYFLYRRPHSGPRLKYMASGPVTSVLTREPGPVPAPAATPAADAALETVAPEAAEAEAKADAPEQAEAKADAPEQAGAAAEDDATDSATEGKE